MKNKHLLLIGAGVLAIYLWKRSQNKKVVVVTADAGESKFSSAHGATLIAGKCMSTSNLDGSGSIGAEVPMSECVEAPATVATMSGGEIQPRTRLRRR